MKMNTSPFPVAFNEFQAYSARKPHINMLKNMSDFPRNQSNDGGFLAVASLPSVLGGPSIAAGHGGVAQRPKCHSSAEEQQLRARAEAVAWIQW